MAVKGPWGNQPSSPQQPKQPPKSPPRGPQSSNSSQDWDEFIKRSQDRFKGMMGNQRPHDNPVKLWTLGILIAVVLWLFSGFYIIQPGERGVILRLGKFERTTTPGANYHLPTPLESLLRVNVEKVNTEAVGFSSNGTSGRRKSNTQSEADESLMLTGDENIVDINMEVQWNIKNAKDYLFSVRDEAAENTIKSAAESAVREVIGRITYTDALLGETRAENALAIRKQIQEILDSYHMGVNVLTIQIKKIDPPAEVIDAFRDVQSARADREKDINQAEAYRNDILPRARGNAAKITQDAEAYEKALLAKSEGESQRFESVVSEYQKSPQVTKDRMYIETLESIYGGMNKLMVDKQATGNGIMPYLSLPELTKKSPSPSSSPSN
ncbi:MAG: FtsH protease activity modulator HflK [Alphaproteobacteria bacterium]|nr:FtsH protease activity modulator HflK [Alphaproteobacteria bacterium]